MKHSPLSKDLSVLFPARTPADRSFSDMEAGRSISRIRDAAARADSNFEVAHSVDLHLKWLLKHGGPGTPEFVADVLHGGLGEPAMTAAWRLFATGITVPDGNGRDTQVSVSAYCLANGTLKVLKALVDRGIPRVVHRGMFGRQEATQSLWLTMLCTTSAERSHAEFPGLAEHGGLVELAAVNHDYFPAHADAALELAWSVDREQPGFAGLAESNSAEGAVVRHFVMRKRIEAATAAAGAQSRDEAAPTTVPRARRAAL